MVGACKVLCSFQIKVTRSYKAHDLRWVAVSGTEDKTTQELIKSQLYPRTKLLNKLMKVQKI